MSDDKEAVPDLRANRRREALRATRGRKLTGQRGTWSVESGHWSAAGARKIFGDDKPASMRRARLGGVIEDEADSAVARDTRLYSEPNE